MKKISIFAVCLVLFLAVCYATSGHLHLPGHGNVEKQNLQEVVVNHVTSTLTNGESVEFVSNSKETRTAHIICNEDRDKIYEWKDI